MNWINISIESINSMEFVSSDPLQRSTWLSLLAWSVQQENNGVIKDCAKWGSRMWQQLCGVTLEEVTDDSKLYHFEGENLHILFYPHEQQAAIEAKRKNGMSGGRPKNKEKEPQGLGDHNHEVNHVDNHKVNLDTQKQEPRNNLKGKERNSKGIVKNPPISPKGDRDTIFPRGSLSKPLRDQKKIKVLRNLKSMVRIGSWFGRNEKTLWTVAEANALKLVAPTQEEVDAMEKYYKSGSDILRRDLQTLLNNWSGELDRAGGEKAKKKTQGANLFPET